MPKRSTTLLGCGIALVLGAFDASAEDQPRTLDGKTPMVIAHRGASGYLPEETYEAYIKAIELGADAIEPDLISTKDGVLIARHDANLAMSTDVAKHPKFAGRKKTVLVDGESQTGWFAGDFILAEIKTLGGISTDPERPRQFNGLYKYKIVTFQEIVDLAKSKSGPTRTVAIYPETKNPSYHRSIGLPLEDKLIELIVKAGWNANDAPIFVQSFEPNSLKEMRRKGLKTRMVQLIAAGDVDLKTGKLTFTPPYVRPSDWSISGDKRRFSDMVTPAGLAEIKTYADGIGPWKAYIISVKGQLGPTGNVLDVNGDGTVDYSDAACLPPSTLIADAHKAGLFVHAYTFRNERRRIPVNFKSDPIEEYKAFYRLGIDGVFTDFVDTAVAARAAYLREIGR